MMVTNHLSLVTYILVLASILIHYPIGQLFGQRSLLTGAFVGVCVSAFVVAILANIFAGGIRFYILSSLIALSFVSLRLLWKSRASFSVAGVLTYASIGLVGLAFLFLNSPWDAYFQNDKTVLGYNGHYTYYSSQSIEMLNADYGSRLKALNLFPKEWATYHFFNSASQAITQALISSPNLFSYFVSQSVLGTFVLLTFVETIIDREKTIVNKALKAGLFMIIGFTVFYDSMRWNLVTSGTISVFAIIHFVLALFDGNKKATLLFGTLLAASAMRLLPVVAPILLFIAFSDFIGIYRKAAGESLSKFLHYLSKRYLIIGLFIGLTVYVFVTLFFAMPNQYTKLGVGIGRYAWVEQLTSHILLTFFTDLFNANWLEYHEPPKMLFRVLAHPSFTFLFLVSIFGISALISFKLQDDIKHFARLGAQHFTRLRAQMRIWKQVGIFLIFVSFFLLNIKFFVVSSFYVVFLFFSFLILRRVCSPKIIHFCFSVVGYSYLLTFLYVSLGGMNGITGPATLVIYDLFLWGLVLIIILKSWNYKKLSHGLIAALIAISFHGKVSSIFAYGHLRDVALAELDAHSRAYHVNQDGFLTEEAIEIAKGDGKLLEAYSAILGARLRYSLGNNANHINFPHVWTQ